MDTVNILLGMFNMQVLELLQNATQHAAQQHAGYSSKPTDCGQVPPCELADDPNHDSSKPIECGQIPPCVLAEQSDNTAAAGAATTASAAAHKAVHVGRVSVTADHAPEKTGSQSLTDRFKHTFERAKTRVIEAVERHLPDPAAPDPETFILQHPDAFLVWETQGDNTYVDGAGNRYQKLDHHEDDIPELRARMRIDSCTIHERVVEPRKYQEGKLPTI